MAVLKTRSGDDWISLAGVKGDTGPIGPTGPTGPASTQIDSTAVTTNASFFPVFVAGTGTQTPSIRTATTAFSFNPSTSVLTLGGSVVANGVTLTGNTGTVTSIATNNGLTGGTITTTGTLGLTGQALALHNLATTGLIARTAADTVAARTITGTTNQVTVTNGNGVSGNPTLSLPQSINTAASVQFGSFGVGTAASGVTGEIRATNEITAYFSDARLKNITGLIDSPIQKISKLSGVYYYENEVAKSLGYSNDNRQVGVIAQEVESILPEAVTSAPIDDKYLTVKYEKLIPLLIECIKNQQVQIEELRIAFKNLIEGK